MHILEQGSIANRIGHPIERNQLLGLAVRCGKINLRAGALASALSAPPNSPISSCALSMRAFDFVVRAFGPRRNQSISVCTRFSSAAWRFLCA